MTPPPTAIRSQRQTLRQTLRSPARSLALMLRRRLLRWLLAGRSPLAHRRFAVLPDDLVSEEVLVAGLYEETLLRALFDGLLADRRDAFAAGVALDVGANIGNHTLWFAQRFARVHACEPNPRTLALLRCNVELAAAANVEVHGVGLGDRDGELPFASDDGANLGGSGFVFAGVAGGREIVCPLRRGDGLLPPARLGGPLALVKLDVEGAELAALQGLEQTLARERPVVVFESNRRDGVGGGAELLAWLRARGYDEVWSVDEEAAASTPLRRLATRLWHGEVIASTPLTVLPDRRYAMLVAFPAGAPPRR